MQPVIDKSAIKDVFTSVTVLRRKESAVDQEKLVDNFLDSILELRKILDEKSETLEDIERQMVTITHIDHSDLLEEDYESLRALITEAKRAYSVSMRFYAAIRGVRVKGIAREETTRFSDAVSMFKETTEGLELAFFTLPQTEGFKEVNDRLAALLG